MTTSRISAVSFSSCGESLLCVLRTRCERKERILRSELDPHFLFNTLNSIAALTQKDPEATEQMTLKLSSLLRISLDCNASLEIPLRQELQLHQTYLDIQQTRFRDRLTIRMAKAGGPDLPVPFQIASATNKICCKNSS